MAEKCLDRDTRTFRPQHGSTQFREKRTFTQWEVAKSVNDIEKRTGKDVKAQEAAFDKLREEYETKNFKVEDTPSNRRALRKLYPVRPEERQEPEGTPGLNYAKGNVTTYFERPLNDHEPSPHEHGQGKSKDRRGKDDFELEMTPEGYARAVKNARINGSQENNIPDPQGRSEASPGPSMSPARQRHDNAEGEGEGQARPPSSPSNDPEPSMMPSKIQQSPTGNAEGDRGREVKQQSMSVDLSQIESQRPQISQRAYRANLHGQTAVKAADTTKREYETVARRQERIPLDQFPNYMTERREELSRRAWWKEHAVARKTVVSAKLYADRNKLTDQSQKLQQIDEELQSLNWQDRKARDVRQTPNTKRGVTPEQYADLKEAVQDHGNLHDALVIANATGARPKEFENGIELQLIENDVVSVKIHGAKKTEGLKEAKHKRFRVKKGADRQLLIKSNDLAEVARRRELFQETMKPLQDKLGRIRKKVPGAEHVSFYSFRHQHKTDLEEQGLDTQAIAADMGHKGLRSQDAYGVIDKVTSKRKKRR
jgi:integrase